MLVRAKFKVEKIEDVPSYDGSPSGKRVILWPVVGGSEENDRFFKFTPAGQIDISTVNAAAAEQFAVGDEFYVDFTPAHVARDLTGETDPPIGTQPFDPVPRPYYSPRCDRGYISEDLKEFVDHPSRGLVFTTRTNCETWCNEVGKNLPDAPFFVYTSK